MGDSIFISVEDVEAILGHLRRARSAGHTVPADPRVVVALRRVRKALDLRGLDDELPMEITLPGREHAHSRPPSGRHVGPDVKVYRHPSTEPDR